MMTSLVCGELPAASLYQMGWWAKSMGQCRLILRSP